MQEHYTVLHAGTPEEREVLTGRTVVHRESAWDDVSRERALAFAEWEDGKCPCGCGQQVEQAWDPDQVWDVQHYVCYAERARAQIDRLEEKRHENDREGWDDGRHSYVVAVDDDRPVEKRPAARRRRRRGGTSDDD